jgi:hypothetical protein
MQQTRPYFTGFFPLSWCDLSTLGAKCTYDQSNLMEKDLNYLPSLHYTPIWIWKDICYLQGKVLSQGHYQKGPHKVIGEWRPFFC